MMFDNSESADVAFDNSAPPRPSRRQQIKDHIPIVLLVLGVVGLMVSLHTGVVAVAVLAAGHAIVGVLGVAGTWLVRRRSAVAPQ